jgi:hypothetical protein
MDCSMPTPILMHIDKRPLPIESEHYCIPETPRFNKLDLPTVTTLSTTLAPISVQLSPSTAHPETLPSNHTSYLCPPTSSVAANDDHNSPLYSTNQPISFEPPTLSCASTAQVAQFLCNQIKILQSVAPFVTSDNNNTSLNFTPSNSQPTPSFELANQNYNENTTHLFSPTSSVNGDDELDIYASKDEGKNSNASCAQFNHVSPASHTTPATTQPACNPYRPVDCEDEEFVTSLLIHITSSSSPSTASKETESDDSNDNEMEIECTGEVLVRTRTEVPRYSPPNFDIQESTDSAAQDFISKLITELTSPRSPSVGDDEFNTGAMKAEDVEMDGISLERGSVSLATSPDDDTFILPPNTASDDLAAHLETVHTPPSTSNITINGLIDAYKRNGTYQTNEPTRLVTNSSPNPSLSNGLPTTGIALLSPVSDEEKKDENGENEIGKTKIKNSEKSRLTVNDSAVEKTSPLPTSPHESPPSSSTASSMPSLASLDTFNNSFTFTVTQDREPHMNASSATSIVSKPAEKPVENLMHGYFRAPNGEISREHGNTPRVSLSHISVSGRSTVNHEGPMHYAGIFENQSDRTDIYLGPSGEKPGIFAYGPFSIYSYSPTTFNYHIYIHPTSDHEVLEHFAYGGPEFLYGNEVILHTLPISPSVIDSSDNMLLQYTTLTHQIEAYLRGDPRYKDGVQIPDDLLVNPIHIPTNVLDHVYFRFPLVETLLSTLAARLSHSRLAHPYGRYTLRDLKQLVNPLFPVLRNPSNALVKDLQTPELPFIQAKFLPCESTHPEDIAADLPVPYFGCLRRYEAFLFQKKFPTYAPQLYHEAMATVHLVALHADPKTRPPPANGGVIDWKQVLEPYNFADFFPLDTPSHLLLCACPNSSTNNFWFPRVQYILQCARQINQLIRVFETFFLTIGYKGLRDLADEIWLNKEVDFLYSPILSYDQAVYFTTLYDFLLREHAGFLARPILQLLHITFPRTEHLDYVFEHIVDTVERPLYLYQLNREDDESSSSST